MPSGEVALSVRERPDRLVRLIADGVLSLGSIWKKSPVEVKPPSVGPYFSMPSVMTVDGDVDP